MRLAMVQPVLVPVAPSSQPKAFPPVRNYRIRNTSEPMQLVGVATSDLLAYPHTRNALIQALEAYYAASGPFRAHTIVIEARDWIGHFVVDENENHEIVAYILVEGADINKAPKMDEIRPTLAWA